MSRLVVVSIGALALLMCCTSALVAESKLDLLSHWTSFKAQFGKQYKTPAEEARRLEIFAKNKLEIDRFNAEESEQAGYTQGLNHLSDKTKEEISKFNGYKPVASRFEQMLGLGSSSNNGYLTKLLANDDDSEPPAEVDWRKEGRVSSVKDQGNCGSCWAFGTIGLLEGQQKVEMNVSQPIDLSVQQLIDCSGMGCYGGDIADALLALVRETGIMTEKDYPYTAKDGHTCNLDRTKVVMKPKNYSLLPKNDEANMKKVLAKYGPIGVYIGAGWESFMHYKSGVYSDEQCGLEVDHCVLLVGYGTDPKQGDYWIVKNSWGKNWGEEGYVRMAMHKNMCQIAIQPTIAIF